MGADFFFRMGSTHAVCQDYAAAGQANGLTFAVLSDGCSSSPDTDFGARFLVQALRLNVGWDPSDFGIAAAARRMSDAAGLPSRCLDATLLFAMLGEKHAEVWRAGDGVVAWRRRDGVWFFNQISFENNAPQYLSYLLEPQLTARHAEICGSVTERAGVRDPAAGAAWAISENEHPTSSSPFECWYLDRRECDLVIVFSDGIESFVDATGAAVPLEQVLDKLLDFKGLQGQFVARRCARFLSKTCVDLKWSHSDDFAAAGIYFGEAP